MSQQSGFSAYTPPNPAPVTPPGLWWGETWFRALTHPSTRNYEEIASDTPVTGNSKAYVWIFVTSVIVTALGLAVNMILTPQIANTQGIPTSEVGVFQTFSLLSFICVPVQGIFAIFGFAIYIGITQFFANRLGGKGNYSRLLYTSAAFASPMTIIRGVIALIPVVNLLSIPLGLYVAYLDVLTVKAVNQFSWGRAFLASLGLWLIFTIIVTIIILALLGPSFANVYSNVMRTVQPKY